VGELGCWGLAIPSVWRATQTPGFTHRVRLTALLPAPFTAIKLFTEVGIIVGALTRISRQSDGEADPIVFSTIFTKLSRRTCTNKILPETAPEPLAALRILNLFALTDRLLSLGAGAYCVALWAGFTIRAFRALQPDPITPSLVKAARDIVDLFTVVELSARATEAGSNAAVAATLPVVITPTFLILDSKPLTSKLTFTILRLLKPLTLHRRRSIREADAAL